MTTHVDSRRTDRRRDRAVPAYGPIDAALGLGLFYVVVTRATPAVVDVATEVLPGVSASAVGFGLAAFLWFVFVVTAIDQTRRQLAALGVVEPDRDHEFLSRLLPTERWPLGVVHLAALLVGALLAWLTFERGIETAVSLVRVVGTLDWPAFDPGGFVAMVVFFVSFGVATKVLDRLVIGGIRAVVNG